MPTDPAVMDVLDKVAVRRSAASAFPTAVPFDVTRSPSATSHFGNASFARVTPIASLAAAAPPSPSKSMSTLIFVYQSVCIQFELDLGSRWSFEFAVRQLPSRWAGGSSAGENGHNGRDERRRYAQRPLKSICTSHVSLPCFIQSRGMPCTEYQLE